MIVMVSLKDNNTFVGEVADEDVLSNLSNAAQHESINRHLRKEIDKHKGINLCNVMKIISQLGPRNEITTHRVFLKDVQYLKSVNTPIFIPYESILYLTAGPFSEEFLDEYRSIDQKTNKEKMLEKAKENDVIEI